jgi:nucleotide-binding universal stress UspA family protein
VVRIRRILMATDFSKASKKAFDTAVALAQTQRATSTSFHVIAPFTPVMPEQYIGPPTWDQIDVQTREWTKRELGELAEHAKRVGVRSLTPVAEGEPARQIVRAARLQKADLVVVGTHGRTGFTKYFLGSVASRVVATTPCAVVTVRGS